MLNIHKIIPHKEKIHILVERYGNLLNMQKNLYKVYMWFTNICHVIKVKMLEETNSICMDLYFDLKPLKVTYCISLLLQIFK